jgi:internalin A
MSDSDDAYERARAAIARAKAEGAEVFELRADKGFADLDRLPPEIGDLTRLRGLSLSNTRVADLSPLAGLTGLLSLSLARTPVADLWPLAGLTALRRLDLDTTPAADLRPLRGLTRLAEAPRGFGLRFTGCGAAKADPRIAEIAEIEDSTERARTLFDYLRDWEPPEAAAEEAPQPDPLAPIAVEDGRLEIAASQPTEAERDEALKRALHEPLRSACAALAQAAGNRFPRLAQAARALAEQIACPFPEVDLLGVHLALSSLRSWQAEGAEDGEAFTGEVRVALDQVLQIGPGLTLDHPAVELFEARRRRFEEQPRPEAARAAQDAFSAALVERPDAVGPRLRAYEQAILDTRDDAARAPVQEAAARNIFIRVGRAALVRGETVVLGALGSAVFAFLASTSAAWLPVLQLYGQPFAQWFLSAIARVPELAALAQSVDPALLRSAPPRQTARKDGGEV